MGGLSKNKCKHDVVRYKILAHWELVLVVGVQVPMSKIVNML